MIDDELLAFVVTGESVDVVRGLASEREVEREVEQFRFQINTLRYGVERMRRHLPRLTERVHIHLQSLYELLLAPIMERVGERRLVIVPNRALHYIPFHALRDQKGFIIEGREVSYAPSAVVLEHCLAREEVSLNRALLVGVADEATPRVRDEIRSLEPLFPKAVTLLDEAATTESLLARAPQADVIHLACHGQFRPDNPLFSSLRLADGWLTVREAAKINLKCGLVTLSACETGVSHVAPGEELLGLVRAFLAAGAPSLLLSLWTVDDEATANLMASFYKRLRAGEGAAAALRQAQLEQLEAEPHPYFWSPFVLVGRW
jgi:CHAT domain-containing protein